MKPPPIYTWIEPLDAAAVAGVARCFVVRGGAVYGLAVFRIVDLNPESPWSSRRQARDDAEDYLKETVAKDHGGRLPYVGRLRDLNPDGVDLSW